VHAHLYSFENLPNLLPCAIRQPSIVRAIFQIAIGLPTGRTLPHKFFGGHIGVVVLVVRDLKDEFIDFDAVSSMKKAVCLAAVIVS
jgi:hypothetical protein